VKRFEAVTGRMCPLPGDDIDTDQIVPKQFLKRVERTGYGPFAFHDRRYAGDGTPDPAFPMNRPEHAGAPILLTGRNFGSGSSREHAAWALEDAGFAVVVACSFADIFRQNCANIGLLTVALAEREVKALFARVHDDPAWEATVDLVGCTVTGDGFRASFDIDSDVRHRLLEGLDFVALAMGRLDAIAEFEQRRPAWRPRIAL